jgi:hypothetical protein
MTRFSQCKPIAGFVIAAYLSLILSQHAGAAPESTAWQVLAQERGLMIDDPGTSRAPQAQTPVSAEDRNAREAVLTGKMQRLDQEMNAQKGMRKNFLNIAVGAFAIGATLTFGVNQINAAIDKILVENPETNPEGCFEERVSACETYVFYTEEKRDAQDGLDGIKGIGSGIFLVGIASVVGYVVTTYVIRGKQQRLEALRTASETLFDTGGLTPDYLRRNESVAAVIAEIDAVKKTAGSTRTTSELLMRVALGTFSSGLFLFGLSNVAHTLVGNISIDENNPADVSAKANALDETDALQDAGVVLMGIGAASGIAAYVFHRLTRGHELRINTLEDSLWRVAESLEFQPRVNGFRMMYSYAF